MATAAEAQQLFVLIRQTFANGNQSNLAEIDRQTGAVTIIGGDHPVGSGERVTAIDPVNGVFYFAKNVLNMGTTRHIWSLDTETGALLANPVISATVTNPRPQFLEFDPSLGNTVGVIAGATGGRTLAEIESDTGLADVIGPAFSAGGEFGISTYDEENRLLYFSARPTVGSGDRSIYTVDVASGNLLASPALVGPVGFPDLVFPQGLEFDPDTGRIMAVVQDGVGGTTRYMCEIDPDTGAVMPIDTNEIISASSTVLNGVSTLDPGARAYYFPVSTTLWIVDVDTGEPSTLPVVMPSDYLPAIDHMAFAIPVPEPATLLLQLCALGAVVTLGWRRRPARAGRIRWPRGSLVRS